MKPCTRNALLILAGLLLLGGAWLWLRSAEPAHQGRKLSVWLRDLGSSDTGRRQQAKVAIQQIGTNALPLLLKRLDPATESELDARMQALRAFQHLGPAARPAIPALAALLQDGRSANDAARALIAIGPASVETLTDALVNPEAQVRSSAARALGEIGAASTPAVPALVKCLQDEALNVRVGAMSALGLIRHDPQTVIPALIENLKEGDLDVRIAAASALAAFGSQASAAVPELSKAARSKAQYLRDAAKAALAQIDAEAAAALKR